MSYDSVKFVNVSAKPAALPKFVTQTPGTIQQNIITEFAGDFGYQTVNEQVAKRNEQQ